MRLLGQGLGWILRTVYEFVSTLGSEPENFSYLAMSIIITTIIIKFLLLPLQLRSSKQMKKTQALQPQVKELQIKFKHDPQEAQRKIQKLYRENDASMTGGCLPLLATLPVMLAFFQVMRQPEVSAFTDHAMYEAMSKSFFWIKDLTLPDPYWYGLPLIVGVTTYLQTLTTPKVSTDPNQNSTMQIMNIMMPLMLFWFSKNYAGGLALYWVTSTIFTAIQSVITNRELLFARKGENNGSSNN